MATQTDNSSLSSKLELRRHFMRLFPAKRPVVFDACCGAGVIWRTLRREFDVRYMAADRKPDPGRLAIRVSDSSRILELPDAVFDVIDLDVYGEPWAMLRAVCGGLTAPATGLLTVGFRRMYGFASGVSPWIGQALGVPQQTPRSMVGSLLEWGVWRLVHAAIADRRLVYAAESTRSARARYLGLRLEP